MVHYPPVTTHASIKPQIISPSQSRIQPFIYIIPVGNHVMRYIFRLQTILCHDTYCDFAQEVGWTPGSPMLDAKCCNFYMTASQPISAKCAI